MRRILLVGALLATIPPATGCVRGVVAETPRSTPPDAPSRFVACQVTAPARYPLLVTVDDLPLASAPRGGEPDHLEAIHDDMLATLQHHGVRAVGFVTFGKVRGPKGLAMLERWIAAGHELGNHSVEHKSYSHTPPEAYLADIEAARARLARLLGARGKPRFFRFPFLREGDTLAKLRRVRAYLRESGQRNVPVTLDTQDWTFEKPWLAAGSDAERHRVGEAYQAVLRADILGQQQLGDRLLGRPAPGVLLLHAGAVGAAQWDLLFCWLRRQGYRFAGADEVLADPVLSELPEYVADYGPGLWDRLLAMRRSERARREIERVLADGAAAWARGDLPAFMAAYAEDAVFVTPSGITHGRQAVLERYQQKYGDKPETMGRLALEIVDVRLAEGNEITRSGAAVGSRILGATVLARWRLEWPDREPGKREASGYTLLGFRRTAKGWQIVHDASM